ncbi:iron-containing alcohol dehydrogenase [Acinetobacter soli]|uniref:iron-containing alcohol dehydrogenase n=1 Tax=Acinetobacter soli TaxID=487316 RepID=UPI002586AF84|nr:iron-containing alcohol dehydrogenase [Acinetobacter soli]MEB4800828.1 iron-containing alcohol dehydrogenase [Acinetobacter soli]
MQNFTFYNPTKIVFGQNSVEQLETLIASDARIMMIYGGQSAEKTGTLKEIRDVLGHRIVKEFGGVEPNPRYETLMRAVELIKSNDIDYLLAVGGGSVIDGTKFIAAAALYTGEPWNILKNQGADVEQALAFGCVLTLPATGSEMNAGAVITRGETQDKLFFNSTYVFPQFSILDPLKTYTLPERQLANGVVDAFTHVMEQYLTYPAGGYIQDRMAEGLLQTLIEIGPRVLSAEKDDEARANLMWVATLALNGLIGAGVPQDWSTHMIGHELTALYEIDHARTLAVVLPANLSVRRESKAAKLLQYAERVWQIREGSEQARINAAIEQTKAFFKAMGIPTQLGDYDLGHEAIDKVVAQLEHHGMTALGEHSDVTLAISRQILEKAL